MGERKEPPAPVEREVSFWEACDIMPLRGSYDEADTSRTRSKSSDMSIVAPKGNDNLLPVDREVRNQKRRTKKDHIREMKVFCFFFKFFQKL